MRYIFIGLGTLVILALGVMFIAPSLVPAETYRTRIQEQLSQELDRDVELQGDVSISTFPALKARVDGVRIANPDGFTRTDFATLDSLDARIRLLPLFSRRVEISRFILRRPDIALERRADGAVNWAFGDPATDTQVEDIEPKSQTPDGPFKRDGRYTNFDPNVGAFQIVDGKLSYQDDQAGTAYSATDINTFLSLPSLSDTLSIEGNFISEGRPVSVDMKLDNPRDVLSGEAGTIDGMIAFGDIKLVADGRIPASQDLGFAGQFEIEADDLSILAPYLENPDPLRAISRVKAKGQMNASPQILTLADALIEAEGEAGQINYDGSGSFDLTSQAAQATGQLNMDLRNPSALATLLPNPVPGLEEIEGLTLTADLNTQDGSNRVEARNINVKANGPSFDAGFTGQATYTDEIDAQGQFDLRAENIAALLSAFEIEAPADAALLRTADITGNLDYSTAQTRISNMVVNAAGDDFDASYTGQVETAADTVTLSGKANATVSDMAVLNAKLSQPLPYADAIGRAQIEADMTGQADNLNLSNVTATLEEGDLNGRYEGSATISESARLDGNLMISGSSLRQLLTHSGSPGTLPPSTEQGQIFEDFKVSGRVSGTPDNLTFANADVQLDDLSGQGQFGVTMTDERPVLSGRLDMAGLDLRPYMAAYSAQAPEGGLQEWSEEPLAVDGLRAAEGTFTLTTPSINLTRLTLDQTTVNATLEGGRLSADIPSLSLYGGRGKADMTFDVSGATPTVALNASLNQLETKGFLSAIAGFAKASGDFGTEISVRGQGQSQAAIMRTLTGGGDFQVLDGTVSGIDATKFLTGLDQALRSRALPDGLGQNEITKFRDLLGRFSLENGVAKVSNFSMQGLGFAADGQGQVNLGAQTIDFRLRPKRTGPDARGLAAFGIPLRISGPFNQARPGLDDAFLGEIVEAKARSEAQKLIERNVGGSVGGLIGNVLGGGHTSGSTGTTTQSGTNTGTSPSANNPQTLLDGLLKPRQDNSDTTTNNGAEDGESNTDQDEAPDARSDEEVVTDVLKGLFGRKEKKDEEN